MVGLVAQDGPGLREAPPHPPPRSLTPGQVKDIQVWDPQGLQTLFLETLCKLTRQGFVPYKSVREVMRWVQMYPASGPRVVGSTLCPMQGFSDVPAPERGALNSGSVSWAPTNPRPHTSGALPCFGCPPLRWGCRGRGGRVEAVSEAGAPLFPFQLLLQAAAGSAADLGLQGQVEG